MDKTIEAVQEADALVLMVAGVFDAPRALVFKAWTEPERFASWFGPHGSTVLIYRMDVRPGGELHFCHRFEDYPDVWVKGVYTDVLEPERLVFTTFFSNEAGERVERPGFPSEMQIAVTFAEREGRTEVAIRQTGLVEDQGELQGWREAMDRLDTLLSSELAA